LNHSPIEATDGCRIRWIEQASLDARNIILLIVALDNQIGLTGGVSLVNRFV